MNTNQEHHQTWWEATHPVDGCGLTSSFRIDGEYPKTTWSTTEEQHWAYTNAAGTNDVYHSAACCPVRPDKGKGGKDSFPHTHTLWADLDYGLSHKREAVLSDLDETLEVVRTIKLPPTLTVHTGAGVHLYWTLDEPMLATDAEDAMFIIQHVLRSAAEGRGVDAVWNIDRVLRTPGSIHRNGSPVEVIDTDDPWSTVDLTAKVAALQSRINVTVPSKRAVATNFAFDGINLEQGRLVLDRLCDPDGGALHDQELGSLWLRGVTNMLKDQTPSGATLSVARRVHGFTLTYGEPTATMLAVSAAAAWRERWANGTKIGRADYWDSIAKLLAVSL